MYQTSSNGTRTKRRSTRIAITAVLLGAMLSSTLVANAEELKPEPTTFRSDKASAAADLAALALNFHDQQAALTGLDFHDQKKDSHDQKKLDKALKELNKGLADKYWAADGETLVGKGEHVFRRDARAIRHLEKIKDLDVGEIIDTIVDIDFKMAQAAIADAAAAGADTTKVERTMAKAAQALADGNLSKAVDLYGTAWRNAARAKPKAPKASTTSAGGGRSFTGSTGSTGSNGKYSTYEVVLVRTDTVGTGSPEFISVSGSNEAGTDGYTGKSTEGYLFDSRFGPGDTFLDPMFWPTLDPGGIMQLHVSCSDVFAGGFGSKSDPAATSQWMINSIHIVKHQGESTDKECDVIGAGLPTPPEPPDAASTFTTTFTPTTTPPTTTVTTVPTVPIVPTDPCASAAAPAWCFYDA